MHDHTHRVIPSRTSLPALWLTLGALAVCSACAGAESDRLNRGSDPADDPSGASSTGGSATASGGTTAASGGSSTGGALAGDDTPVPALPADSVCLTPVVAAGACPLVDDFEDGDELLLPVEGRVGAWYAYNDGTGSALPDGAFQVSADDSPDSEYAVHTTGADFVDYGGGVGFHPGGCYDASAYTGMSFWAKGEGRVHVTVATAESRQKEYGGDCEGDGCGDNFGTGFDLTDSWEPYSFSWEELYQIGWGVEVDFDVRHLVGVDIAAYNPGDGTPIDWDFWVDDVGFTGGSPDASACAP